jgi:hypothetical protein
MLIMPDAKWIGRVTTGHVIAWTVPCLLVLQLLWMRQTLKDYGYTMNYTPLLCYNESAIKIAYNSCEHYKTKHIDI